VSTQRRAHVGRSRGERDDYISNKVDRQQTVPDDAFESGATDFSTADDRPRKGGDWSTPEITAPSHLIKIVGFIGAALVALLGWLMFEMYGAHAELVGLREKSAGQEKQLDEMRRDSDRRVDEVQKALERLSNRVDNLPARGK
jgi:hypothetical protein